MCGMILLITPTLLSIVLKRVEINFSRSQFQDSRQGNYHVMHHKVIIIDERIVVTGSYNFSINARTRNDENTLIIHSPPISTLFRDEFARVWVIAQESQK